MTRQRRHRKMCHSARTIYRRSPTVRPINRRHHSAPRRRSTQQHRRDFLSRTRVSTENSIDFSLSAPSTAEIDSVLRHSAHETLLYICGFYCRRLYRLMTIVIGRWSPRQCWEYATGTTWNTVCHSRLTSPIRAPRLKTHDGRVAPNGRSVTKYCYIPRRLSAGSVDYNNMRIW